jgi:hypothetical protein
MQYGELLGSAWKIFWKFKILWLFNVAPYLIYSLGIVVSGIVFFFGGYRLITDTTADFSQPWLQVLMILAVFGFMGIIFVTNLIGVNATVVGVSRADGGVEKLPFLEVLDASLPFFWRVLGLYILYGAGLIVIIGIFMGCLSLVIIGTLGYGALCVTPISFLVIPIELLASVLLELSTAAVVLQPAGTIGGLQQGWALLKNNFWKVVLMGVILYGGFYVLSMISATPLYVVSFLPMLSFMGRENGESFFNGMLLVLAIAMPFYMIFSGIMLTYLHTAWTLAYLRLSGEPVKMEPVPTVNA